MASPTQKNILIAVSVGAAILVGIRVGTITPSVNGARTRLTATSWAPGEPTLGATVCVRDDRRLGDRALQRLLNRNFAIVTDADGGIPESSRYVGVQVCFTPDAGTPNQVPDEEDTQRIGEPDEVPWQAGFPTLAMVLPADPLWTGGCACSTGASCNTVPGGTPIPKSGNTLRPGTFTGAGCIKKPCVELAGAPSMPASCL